MNGNGQFLLIDYKENGIPWVVGTRITVAHIAVEHNAGRTVEQMLEDYPVLYREGIEQALAYYAVHHDEIDAYVEAGTRMYEEGLRAQRERTDPAWLRLVAVKREWEQQRAARPCLSLRQFLEERSDGQKA